MNDVVKIKVEDDQDEFDKIFFANHGVGFDPISDDDKKLIHSLDNTKPSYQEIEFVRLFFREGNITDAYIRAFGYKGDEHRRDYFTKLANRLINRPRVLQKLNDYREKAQALEDEDVANLVKELNDAKDVARTMGMPAAMVSAVKAKAQLLGLEKSTVNTMNVVLDLTDDQKRNLLGRISSRLQEKLKSEITDAQYEELE